MWLLFTSKPQVLFVDTVPADIVAAVGWVRATCIMGAVIFRVAPSLISAAPQLTSFLINLPVTPTST